MIHLHKYDGIRPLAGPLGAYLLRSFPRDEAFDCIVPVPLHWRRRWKRGFNQSELLAGVLARATGIKVRGALGRVQATATQAGLSNSARRRNVAQAFHCSRPGTVSGQAHPAGGRRHDYGFYSGRLRRCPQAGPAPRA